MTHHGIPPQKHDLPMTALSSRVSVWCVVLVNHNLPWSSAWHPNGTWLVSQQPYWYQAFGQDPNSCPTWATSSVHFWRGWSIMPSLQLGPLHMLYLWPRLLHPTLIVWKMPPHFSGLSLNIIFSRKASLIWQRSKASHYVLLLYHVILLLQHLTFSILY